MYTNVYMYTFCYVHLYMYRYTFNKYLNFTDMNTDYMLCHIYDICYIIGAFYTVP